MNSQKQILIISAIFMMIFTMIFLNIRMEYKAKHNTTQKELNGVSEITNIHKLNIILKSLRGINQLEKYKINYLKQKLFISDEKVLKAIKNLRDKDIAQLYNKLISSQNLSKIESFKQYTYLLKLLDQKRFNIADSSKLLFEENREMYFLMSIAVLNIPDAIENIGRIRALGVGILSSDIEIEEDNVLLKSNIQMFLDRIDKIKFILSKLSLVDSSKLNALIDPTLTDFYDIVNVITDIEKKDLKVAPLEYFLKTTKLVNDINNIFTASKNMLSIKLEQRNSELEKKLFFGTFLYFFMVLMIAIATYLVYSKNDKDEYLAKKRKDNSDFISILRDEYTENLRLKELCERSLTHIINNFNAINGSLYIFNKDNNKLYLGSTYGIKSGSLEQTLDLHENTISENIIEKKLKVTDIEQEINLGNITIIGTKLVTIPILEFEDSIGTVQLLFDKRFKDVDLEFLQEVISLMASYIFKAQKDDESIRYLKLIDKNVLISKTDLDGNIIEVSEEFCNLSKYSKDELIGQNHRIVKHEDMSKDIFIDMWDTITKGQTWRGEVKNRKKDGDQYWVDSVITPDCDINGNIIGYTALRTNITDKKKIEEIAITDGLTSLYNRRHFDELFPTLIKIAKRNRTLLAFVMMDIDHFKQYNDTYGHQAGDIALKSVAQLLSKSLKRPDDYTFRLGGEEFGMIYTVNDKEDAQRIANEVRQNIEKLNIVHSGNSASSYVTMSMGLYIIENNNLLDTKDIYKKTDEALYTAKQSGRNKVSIVKLQ